VVHLTADDLADKITCHVKINLRRSDSNVSKVSSEQRQLGGEIGIGLIPSQQPQDGESMAEVVKPWALAPATMLDACGMEYATEGLVQALTRCRALTIGTRKECVGWCVMFQLRYRFLSIILQTLCQIRSDWHGASFAKFPPHLECVLIQIDVLILEAKHLSAAQAGE
jgi:hypothetical protein